MFLTIFIPWSVQFNKEQTTTFLRVMAYRDFVKRLLWGPPGVLGIWGEWLFIFRDLRSTGNYFRGSGEQAHSFGDLGSPAKKQKNKGKDSILFVL